MKPEELVALLSDAVTDAVHPPGDWVFIQDVVGTAWRAIRSAAGDVPLEACHVTAWVDQDDVLRMEVAVTLWPPRVSYEVVPVRPGLL